MIRWASGVLFLLVFTSLWASKVEVVHTDLGFQLLKDGVPYYINGAGGTVELSKLKEYGGNSIRTWGVTDETDKILDEAHANGLTVTFGIWMGQERQGFDYSNQAAVKAQLEEFRKVIRKYKDHPAILIWGVGNEMDLDYSNFDVWKYLEEICKMVHEEDPNHPTMAVTAGLDVAEIKLINRHAPSLDILGVNTYGDISYLPKAIQSYGWTKPYIVAEWGPYGWWEVPKTSWGASLEENSAQKAGTYSKSLQAILSDKSNCLGSYVFYWGQKQEHTSTWFGLFTAAGEETEVMDVLVEGWSGSKPGNRAPHLESFSIEGYVPGKDFLCLPNSTMNAEVVVVDPDNDPLKYEWQLVPESNDKKTGGDAERAPLPVKGIFSKSALEKTKITFKVPASGEYRLFIFVHDGKGKVATANVPFKIKT